MGAGLIDPAGRGTAMADRPTVRRVLRGVHHPGLRADDPAGRAGFGYGDPVAAEVSPWGRCDDADRRIEVL